MAIGYLNTVIGVLEIIVSEQALVGISFVDACGESDEETPIMVLVKEQLQEYFDGKRMNFELPLHIEGTDFQKNVWEKLQSIPFGTTVSYKDLAIMIGNEKATRAVGGANNRNKLPIVIPCHRVVGADKQLVGYAGELWRKEKLLQLERVQGWVEKAVH